MGAIAIMVTGTRVTMAGAYWLGIGGVGHSPDVAEEYRDGDGHEDRQRATTAEECQHLHRPERYTGTLTGVKEHADRKLPGRERGQSSEFASWGTVAPSRW